VIGAEPDALQADPPTGWIVGTVDQAAERLHELSQAGVSRVMCQHLLHDDLDAVALLGDRLAPLVA
jgi:alkanesulfonate monooxygenase SsuD/methylene tetrahydromethanopterin reductase-like flavin-dependent oxidoreductase (luciferase family)